VQTVEVTRGTRLTDICADALAFAVTLRRAAEPDVAALRAHVRKLFSEIDQAAAFAGKDQASVQAARYALAAMIDEVVLASSWSIRGDWAGRPLQVEYFNDATAGEEFYRKLEALRGSTDASRREALEVYGLCLGLGFRGRYSGMAGLEEIKALRGRIHAELGGDLAAQSAGTQSAGALSPHWQAEEHLPQIVERIPAWLVAAVGAGVLLVLVAILRLLLNGTENGFIEAIQEGR
jgi:type VI secretion system protein ImpK